MAKKYCKDTWKSCARRDRCSLSRLLSNDFASWIWTKWSLSMPSRQRRNFSRCTWKIWSRATLRTLLAISQSKSRTKKTTWLISSTFYSWSGGSAHLFSLHTIAPTRWCGSTASKSFSRWSTSSTWSKMEQLLANSHCKCCRKPDKRKLYAQKTMPLITPTTSLNATTPNLKTNLQLSKPNRRLQNPPQPSDSKGTSAKNPLPQNPTKILLVAIWTQARCKMNSKLIGPN